MKKKYRHIPWNRYNLEKYRDINFWSYRPALQYSHTNCIQKGHQWVTIINNLYREKSSILWNENNNVIACVQNQFALKLHWSIASNNSTCIQWASRVMQQSLIRLASKRNCRKNIMHNGTHSKLPITRSKRRELLACCRLAHQCFQTPAYKQLHCFLTVTNRTNDCQGSSCIRVTEPEPEPGRHVRLIWRSDPRPAHGQEVHPILL